MVYLSDFQYWILCVISTLALFAVAAWPTGREDAWQRLGWTLTVLGWGFITVRLWLASTDLDRSVTVQGAIGLTLLAVGTVVRRMSPHTPR